jgi:excisionase family DNA binding protein
MSTRKEAEGMEKLALRPTEAAAALGLHVQTVRALVDSGRLAAVRVGRRIVIPRSAIAKFLSESEAEALRR